MFIQDKGCLFSAIIFLSTICLLSCSKKSGGTDADDGNTPYMILDLRVAAVTDSNATLIWTATGDDGDVGTASTYDIRYYKAQITTANWDSANQAIGEPSPRPAGQTDTMVVTGLLADSTYYFALIAYDEADNSSGISNCVIAICFDDFVVEFPDSNLEAAIRIAIQKTTGDIYRSDLISLTLFGADYLNIRDLTGLEYCPNLIGFALNGNHFTDLGPISNLRHLYEVQLMSDSLTALPALPGWTSVFRLFLTDNRISDISALENLTSIHHLYMGNNQVSDIEPLVNNAGLSAGDSVYLDNNPLSQQSLNTYIPALENRGVYVNH